MTELRDFFQKHFHHAPSVLVQAPGRLELLGNHTDYNQGLVLSLAVDKHIQIAASPRSDGLIELVSTAFPTGETFSSAEPRKNPEHPWTDYVKGVLVELKRAGVRFGGFSAAVHGTLPMGAGMSSSAALEVATALAVRGLYPFRLGERTDAESAPSGQYQGSAGASPYPERMGEGERLALARVCLAAENRFVGVNCGILDQISSLFGRADHAILTDCQNIKVELVPLPAGASIVICQSGVKHALVGGEYNELRCHCEAAAQAMGVPFLRAADSEMLESWRARMPARDYECARHIIGEIERVALGVTALRTGDFPQFGRLMFESHASSRDFFGNSSPELDLLVETARQHPDCLGARLTGGGFGGATINLVETSGLEAFSDFMASNYQRLSGQPLEPMLCRVVDGAA